MFNKKRVLSKLFVLTLQLAHTLYVDTLHAHTFHVQTFNAHNLHAHTLHAHNLHPDVLHARHSIRIFALKGLAGSPDSFFPSRFASIDYLVRPGEDKSRATWHIVRTVVASFKILHWTRRAALNSKGAVINCAPEPCTMAGRPVTTDCRKISPFRNISESSTRDAKPTDTDGHSSVTRVFKPPLGLAREIWLARRSTGVVCGLDWKILATVDATFLPTGWLPARVRTSKHRNVARTNRAF